jgi:hypothetical protein
VLDNSSYSYKTSEIRSTIDEQGIRRAEFDMTYRNDQPDIAIIHAIVTNTNARADAGQEVYAGVSVSESEADRAARQVVADAAAIQPHNRDRSMDQAPAALAAEGQPEHRAAEAVPAPQGDEKQVVIKVDEVAPAPGARGQAEAVKEAVAGSGAKTGDIQSTTDEQGIRHSEMKVSYRTDQPEIARISQTLDAVASQQGSSVIEHSSDRAERREISKGYEMAQPQRSQEITR